MRLSSGLKRTAQSPYEETCIFNEETGEVVAIIPPQSAVKVPSITKDIGTDLPYPSEAKTADQLQEVVGMLDIYANTLVQVNHSFISELDLNLGQRKVLSALCRRVNAWNILFTTTGEINLICSGLRARRVLSDLSSYIKVERDFPHKGQIKITIHPHISWKGGYSFRQTALGIWYAQ